MPLLKLAEHYFYILSRFFRVDSFFRPFRFALCHSSLYQKVKNNQIRPSKRIGGFLCYFVSYDCVEPPHIHLAMGRDRNDPSAKFWLEPVSLVTNRGLKRGELRKASTIVEENREVFLEMWNEHCND
ncbi:DUF4160 domain-containing protein [Chloroflexi bacterium TSY]|nr:DUF4160 domain-containing protein [Chloroflexi bacterium TSY]